MEKAGISIGEMAPGRPERADMQQLARTAAAALNNWFDHRPDYRPAPNDPSGLSFPRGWKEKIDEIATSLASRPTDRELLELAWRHLELGRFAPPVSSVREVGGGVSQMSPTRLVATNVYLGLRRDLFAELSRLDHLSRGRSIPTVDELEEDERMLVRRLFEDDWFHNSASKISYQHPALLALFRDRPGMKPWRVIGAVAASLREKECLRTDDWGMWLTGRGRAYLAQHEHPVGGTWL